MADNLSGQDNNTTKPTGEQAPVGKKRKQPSVSIAPRSAVWAQFTRLKGDKDSCSCNYCDKLFGCSTRSGTSNLWKHNENCNGYKNHLESEKQKILTSGDSVSASVAQSKCGSNSLVAIGFSQEACRRATLKMIILDELAFSFVENVGFKHFCSVAVPKFIIPSRRTITRDTCELFMKEKAFLKSKISGSRVSFTTDIWTAPTTTVSYMVITAHYIDVNWQLHRKICSFKPISDHKGETIAKQLENCLIDWGIKKVFTITVDNASANDSAIKILKNKLRYWTDNPLILNGEFMHVRCCAHILNLIVKDGLSEVGSSVVSVRNAVKYVRSSNSRFQAFQIRVEQDKLSRGGLVLDCITRWNSTYLMLSAALKYRIAFDRMADEDKLYDAYFQETENGKKRVGPPSPDDWENVRRLVQFLQIFYDATLAFSSYKKVTSNHCFNEICSIEANLNGFMASMDDTLSNMAFEMKKKFDKYWEGFEINKFLIVASVFDPRCKMAFVTLCFENLHGKDTPKCTEMKEGVLDLLRKLYEAYNALYAKQIARTNQGESESTNQSCETTELSLLDVGDGPKIQNFFSTFSNMVCEKGNVEETSNELDIYLMEKIEMPTSNRLGMQFDILLWWKKESMKFPILAEIARDILAIPVSSVASESAFSTSGRILDQYRSSLTPYMVEALILTQDWLRSSLQSDATMNLKQLLEEIEFMDMLAEEIRKSAGQRHDADN